MPDQKEEIKVTPEKELKTNENENKRKLPPGTMARIKFEDGGYKEFVFTGEIREAPEFKQMARALGYDPLDGEISTYQNDVADITKMAREWLQTDDDEQVSRFIKNLLRKTPSGGSRILNLKRQLQLLWKSERKGNNE